MFQSFRRGLPLGPKFLQTNIFKNQHRNILLNRQHSSLLSKRVKLQCRTNELLHARKYSFKSKIENSKFATTFPKKLVKFGFYLNSKEFQRMQAKILTCVFICFLIYSYFFYEKYEAKRRFSKNVELRREYQAWKEYEKIVNGKDVTFEDLKELSVLKIKERALKVLEYNDLMKQRREEAERRKQEVMETGVFKVAEHEKFANVLNERLSVFEARVNDFLLQTGSSEFNLNHLIENLSEEDLDKPVSEYENLKYESMFHADKMRTRELLKLAQYDYMIKEYGLDTFDDFTIPNYQSIKETLKDRGLPENGEDDKLLQKIYELENIHKVMPPMDTVKFFEEKATEYDSSIKREELIFINGQRKKLAKKLYGDCLETSCGTGRNISYLDLVGINSITFLDPSQKMLETCKEKFESFNDKYSKVAFVKGKCEDLVNDESENKMKYDCVFETFGLCSQKDPVESLNNMAKLLKKDGRIFLLEHGKSSYESLNRMMTNSMEKRLEHWGCRFNLDIGEIIDDSDLEIVSEERKHFGTTWIYTLKLKDDKIEDLEKVK